MGAFHSLPTTSLGPKECQSKQFRQRRRSLDSPCWAIQPIAGDSGPIDKTFIPRPCCAPRTGLGLNVDVSVT